MIGWINSLARMTELVDVSKEGIAVPVFSSPALH
jgi:hypothetical protein